MLSFGLVFDAVLFVLGGFWCYEMLGRWRRDLEELRRGEDAADRSAILVVWGITAIVVILMLNFLVGILRGVGVM